MDIGEIRANFAANANPDDKKPMEAYMRNLFDFYGIRAKKRRDLTKAYIKEAKKADAIDWDFLQDLFSDPKREINYLGLDILKAQSHLLDLADFDRLTRLAQIRPWWDTIDNIDTIIGSLGLFDMAFDEKILSLSQSDNFWLR